MSLFRKKSCFVCGEKAGFAAINLGENQKICSQCEALLRGKYDLIREGAVFRDTLSELDPFYAKRLIEEMRATQAEDTARYGDSYSGIISVIDRSYVPHVGLEEYGEDILLLRGKPVYVGFCEKGSFKEGDRVIVLGKKHKGETTVLKLIPCTGAYPFEEELIAKAHETQYSQNSNAWLVLDGCHDTDIHDKIVKY